MAAAYPQGLRLPPVPHDEEPAAAPPPPPLDDQAAEAENGGALEDRVLAHLPDDLYPGGAKAGWWTKAVQLDLEAKHIIARVKTTPLRLHKV